MRKARALAALLLAVVLLAVAGGSWAVSDLVGPCHPIARDGILDLRDWDLASCGVMSLTGDWEFYWNKLLEPSQLTSARREMTGYTGVPASWNGYVVDGRKLSGDGYATYVLTILTKGNGAKLALRMPPASTAYRLYLNGRERAANGKVGTSARDMMPQYMPLVVSFDDDAPEIRLVVQVSNFVHRRGGLWEAPEIGTEPAVRVKTSRLMVFNLASIGSLITMGFYHACLYVLRRKEKSTVYFAHVCFLFGVRAFLVGEIVLTKIWPSFPWGVALKLEYLTSAGILPLALLFCKEMYPQETSMLVARGSEALCAVFFLTVIVVPTRLSSQLMIPYQVVSVALCGYIMHVLVVASLRRREGAIWLASSALFFILTLINDMLYFNEVLKTGSLSPFGLVVVCFAQAYVLSARFSGAMISVEQLSNQLTALNQHLSDLNRSHEQRVEDRTAALLESNRRLEMINREIERMEQSRNRLLTNIAHDLRTPVTLIQGYVEAILDGVIDEPGERAKYLGLIGTKASGLSTLIEDLFELTQLESRKATFNMRRVQIDEMVSDLYLKYETDIVTAGVNPALLRPRWEHPYSDKGPWVMADPERVDRVFANLIYNAVKFTPNGGRITVRYAPGPTEGAKGRLADVVIAIADTGPGIPAEDLPNVFDRFYKAPRSRTQAPGSGLGLSIAKEIVELHGGRIWVESEPDKGSTFYFTLPVAPPGDLFGE